MQDNILVSILCATYNHENYIREALDGFVSQKTNFPFEVLVHDDACTDGTAAIIREYAQKYPDIIKPIYQTVNQYSQGVDLGTLMCSLAHGKYVALCEGDDCWVDERKLQKQVDYMESHPGCALCFTDAYICQAGKIIERNLRDTVRMNTAKADYSMEELWPYASNIPTASMLYPLELILKVPEINPNAFHGDEFIVLFLLTLGYAHLINEVTCHYNLGVKNSATTTWAQNNPANIRYLYSAILMYQEIDRITGQKYHDKVLDSITRKERLLYFTSYEETKDKQYLHLLRQKKYVDISKSKGPKEYIRHMLFVHCHPAFHIIQKVYHMLRGYYAR